MIDLVKGLGAKEEELTASTIFKKNEIHLVEIPWKLSLPQNIRARATAKSSIGRLDVLVRLVTDKIPEYDRIHFGQETMLFVEVIPLTFDIAVRPDLPLSQLRFIKGDGPVIQPRRLRFLDNPVLTLRDGQSVDLGDERHQEGVILTLDVTPDPFYQSSKGIVGFCAKKSVPPLPIDPDAKDSLDPRDYWDPVYPDPIDPSRVRIEKDRFYIFRSRERFHMPPDLAVECQAYSESLGDIRIHYAGFAHPYFGEERRDKLGAPLIFEVRGFSFDTFLWDQAPLARVHFWRMAAPAEKGDMSYTEQELNLSKCFRREKDWPVVTGTNPI